MTVSVSSTSFSLVLCLYFSFLVLFSFTLAYLFLLGCDTNSDVRRAVLSVIAATTKTLAGILERTRDVKDLVRKLAYQVN